MRYELKLASVRVWLRADESTLYSVMTFLRIVIPLYVLIEHDLFGKPVPTRRVVARGHAFPDHALAGAKIKPRTGPVLAAEF